MCGFVVQMDKTWSAQASRPYDPYLTQKGEEQVCAFVLFTPSCSIQIYSASIGSKVAAFSERAVCQVKSSNNCNVPSSLSGPVQL